MKTQYHQGRIQPLNKRRKNKLLVILALLLFTSVVAGWSLGQRNKSDAPAPETVKVIRRDVSSTVLATGTVKPEVGAEVRVGARISGQVEHLYANIGDHVEKGQVIAELEEADLQAAVERARAEVKVAEARVADATARTKLADLDWQRQQNLIKKDFTSQQLLDKALKEKESAHAGHKLAEKQLDAARAALKEAQVKLSYATITAPLSGVIASVSTQQGETVAAGLNAPTFVTIIDLKRIQVDAFVDETDIGKVRRNQKAAFTIDTYPNKDFEGVVSAIYPKAIIQDNVVNYDVVIDIDSPSKRLLRPDMTASVTIYQDVRKGVLMIPQKAVLRESGRKFVFVKEPDGTLQKKTITTGISSNSNIEILAGLSEGDAVVIENR